MTVKEHKLFLAVEPRNEALQPTLARFGLETLSPTQERDIFTSFRTHLRVGLGLERGETSLLTARTFIKPISKEEFCRKVALGEESPVVEIGGTNLYAARVVREDTANGEVVAIKEFITDKIRRRKYEASSDFFDEIGSFGKAVVHDSFSRLGIIWSFPARSIPVLNGVDVIAPSVLPKELRIEGIEKAPVGVQLLNAMGEKDTAPHVVMNDTVAVLLAGFGEIGGVIGTGSNFATTFQGEIYNPEAGGFSEVPQTILTQKIDAESEHPGSYKAEKQISGLYIEKMFNVVTSQLHEAGILDYENNRELTGPDITALLSNNLQEIHESLGNTISPEAITTMQEVARIITTRSAQVAGAIIAALVMEIESSDITVPIEGSVFSRIPEYSEMLQRVIDRNIQNKKVTLVKVEQGGIKGAAIASLAMQENALRRDLAA